MIKEEAICGETRLGTRNCGICEKLDCTNEVLAGKGISMESLHARQGWLND